MFVKRKTNGSVAEWSRQWSLKPLTQVRILSGLQNITFLNNTYIYIKTSNMTHQISNTEKLRVVTRQDLPLGVAAVQSCHAAIDFQHQHPAEALQWHTKSNYLAILTTQDESSLINLITKAILSGVKHTIFREPDLDNQITAVALEASEISRKLTSSYPLMGKKEVNYA